MEDRSVLCGFCPPGREGKEEKGRGWGWGEASCPLSGFLMEEKQPAPCWWQKCTLDRLKWLFYKSTWLTSSNGTCTWWFTRVRALLPHPLRKSGGGGSQGMSPPGRAPPLMTENPPKGPGPGHPHPHPCLPPPYLQHPVLNLCPEPGSWGFIPSTPLPEGTGGQREATPHPSSPSSPVLTPP